jgi:hypothetical protein
MALFIQVFDVEKNCEIIVNIDSVMEIAPLRTGGCEICFPDAAAVGGRRSMKVRNNYSEFKQFVLETVTADDVAKITSKTKQTVKEKAPVGDILSTIPKL